MKHKALIPLSILTCLAPASAPARETSRPHFESTALQAHLIELYSSEGCSSCPPADEWMAKLRSDPELWLSFIPVEFHVDYWNRLGWTDRFSRADYTHRQSVYGEEWGSGSVYTPARVLDGHEWRSSHERTELAARGKKVGKLSADRISETRFHIRFQPEVSGEKWVAYAALLGNGLKSEVKAGENTGRTLRHEFVAFGLAQSTMDKKSNVFEADLDLKAGVQRLMNSGANSTSIAIWVAHEGSQVPVQAVGGDLR